MRNRKDKNNSMGPEFIQEIIDYKKKNNIPVDYIDDGLLRRKTKIEKKKMGFKS